MIPEYRERFNRAFTPERFAACRADLERQCGVPLEFVLSETPCFFPAALMDRLAEVSHTLVAQLLDSPAYRAAADAVVPERFRLSRGETQPTFLQVDFGLVRGPSGLEGRLVELQAFPSLYAFQAVLAETQRRAYGLDETALTPFLGGLDTAGYRRLLGRTLVGDHDPAEVVLLEIDPERQKTRPDFALTEQIWGVRAVDVRDVVREGRRLFARRGGRLEPIARIYNRMIPDELERLGIALPFDLRADLDVEWTGGPDWFFRISKFSIPWLRHPWVPETRLLSEVRELPAPLDRWLLKPLFSFAGSGIVFAPTEAEIAAIPAAARSQFVLQERVTFEPVIDTPHGATQVEIRIMLVRDGDGYRAVLPLLRMGRGKMMGVDHNKGLRWVGSSGALMAS